MSASNSVDASAPQEVVWRLPTRIAFRFFFPFFLLELPFPFLAARNRAAALYSWWQSIIPRVGHAVFGIDVRWRQTGSGDTAYDWVRLFTIAAISLAIMLVWSVLDRRRRAYPTLYTWLRAYVRFSLAFVMVQYGVIKIIPTQFVPPTLDQLTQPMGQASPMRLLWTFMGASMPYTIFSGLGELLGGLLLTTRRTALLGALVSAAVLSNIVMLNFTYDVPVKIFSSILLLAALFIAAPDAHRLLNLLVLNRPVDAAPARALIRWPWLHHTTRVARTLIVIAVVVQGFRGARIAHDRFMPMLTAGALHGIWNVDALTVDDVARPPLLTEAGRWRRMIITGESRASIDLVNDRRERFNVVYENGQLIFTKRSDERWSAPFHYEQPNPDTLLLNGSMDGKKIAATLHKVPHPEFLLITRGFHWISEEPFNR
jgi:hypothetical protein